jgi:tRNA (guanine-N(7)-)-methyltransferase subunit TRM82
MYPRGRCVSYSKAKLSLNYLQLTEVMLDSLLLCALNENCLLPGVLRFIFSYYSASNCMTATADDLRKLDIYGDLVVMPKGTEVGQDQELEVPLPSESSSSGKQLSKRELGRLRSKQAVLAKLQASVEDMTDIPDSEGDDTREPQPKKTRSDSEQDNLADESSNHGVDVSMD